MKDDAGQLHKLCCGHSSQGGHQTDTVLRKSPHQKTRTCQYRCWRIKASPGDKPDHQVDKVTHLLVIGVRGSIV
ncbi:hypothetical protein CSC12_6281 (plasmid) [Klebsiella michiganensis]|nr:hypothetical protein CSC12_6281 [Klebsiella michiganensis]